MTEQSEPPRWRVILKNAVILLVLNLFMLTAVILVNLLPPVYDAVKVDYGLRSINPILVMESMFIISAAISAVFWAFSLDKRAHDRQKIFVGGMLIWTGGALICTIAPSFVIFFFGRLVTAIGIGAQMPAMYSVVADIIPPRFWSTEFAGLALLSAIGNSLGNFLSGFISPLNIWGLAWKFPFFLMSVISVFCCVLILIIQLPCPGETDPIIGDEIQAGACYEFTFSIDDLPNVWNVKTNRFMTYLGFFAVVPGATLASYLIYYFNSVPFADFPPGLRTQIATIFAGGIGVGYLLGTFLLGPIYDYIHSKKPSARATLTALSMGLAIPLMLGAFACITPVSWESLGLSVNEVPTNIDIDAYVLIISTILEEYPIYIAYFVLSFFGTFLTASMTINRSPTILEVNLPEHAATGQSLLNLSDQIGKGLTYSLVALINIVVLWILGEGVTLAPMVISLLFFIPPVIYWAKIARILSEERENKKEILKQRKSHLTARESSPHAQKPQ